MHRRRNLAGLIFDIRVCAFGTDAWADWERKTPFTPKSDGARRQASGWVADFPRGITNTQQSYLSGRNMR